LLLITYSNKHKPKYFMTTIKPTNSKRDLAEIQTSPTRFNMLGNKTNTNLIKKLNFEHFDQKIQTSPTQFNLLSKKTDTKSRQKIQFDQEFQSSPTLKNNKRTFDADFPASIDAASENRRIANITFRISPNPSPTKLHQNYPSVHFKEPAPKHVGSLFAGMDTDAGMDAFTIETEILSNPLPKPNISNSFTLKTQSKELNIVQQTPIKRARAGSVISFFQKLHETLLANTFKYKVTYLAKGNYSNVYTLEGNEAPIIPGVDNSDLVLKAFHGEQSGFVERKLRNFLRNEIENYRAAKAAQLPVGEIYNADTAEQDGYIIQRKVSGKVDALNAEQRSQVSRFFDISVTKRIIFDLLLQNFALEKGQVILIDFIEDPDDDDELDAYNKKIIENWLTFYRKTGISKEQVEVFLNELTANHYQEFVREHLSKLG
jgi:hypothetical protein